MLAGDGEEALALLRQHGSETNLVVADMAGGGVVYAGRPTGRQVV